MTKNLYLLYEEGVASGRIRPDPAQRTVLPLLQSVLAGLARPAPGSIASLFRRGGTPTKGLYLWGDVGRGKSMLVDLCVDAAGVPKRRVHFHAFMQEVHTALNEARAQGVSDALAPVAQAIAASARLLALDEMQIVDITDAMLVGRLFELLLDRGVVVLTTSNLPPDALYKDGLNRASFLPFIALLNERLVVHHLASPTDYRRELLAGQETYFVPADAAARAAMDRLWLDLTGGPPAPLVLAVKGRGLRLPAFRDGVARIAFSDLCGQPLGPADYLALARAVRVLMIEDVPLMSPANQDHARRFVVLVDTLYEARVRVILSAAAEPDSLYPQGKGATEFRRTASRLREMRSRQWVA